MSVKKSPTPPKLPTQMTIGPTDDRRTYDILPVVHEGEGSISGRIVVDHSKDMRASSTAEHGEFIYNHQSDIPAALCGKVKFVFTDWRDHEGIVVCLSGHVSGWWLRDWIFLKRSTWGSHDRFVRLVPNAPKKKAA